MRKPVMNPESDRYQKRVKVAMDTYIATRLENFARHTGLNLSEAGLHFITLGMERQVALNAARRHAETFRQLNEAEMAAMAEREDSAEKEAWDR